MEIILAQPRGFCAGVERAIKVVEEALRVYPHKKIYVFHEIVHNQHILSTFKARGVCFVESVEEVPEDALLILSAHGVSKDIINRAKARLQHVIDATCPLVAKVHKEMQNNERQNRENILIGYKGHQEVIGNMGQVDSNKVHLVQSVADVQNLNIQHLNKLSYVTQTTLSVDDTLKIISALKEKFPLIQGPNLRDICYATQNRQNAIKKLVNMVDIILVIGSKNSSNSIRLQEISQMHNTTSYLIDNSSHIDLKWFEKVKKIGITAGASAPEVLVQDIINFLKSNFNKVTISVMSGVTESVRFKMPKI